MTKRITAHDVKPAADGTTATEFEWRYITSKGEYYFEPGDWRIYQSRFGGSHAFVAVNPHKPRPDWEPPEWLLPGWVWKNDFWLWSEEKPVEVEGRLSCPGTAWLISCVVDTSDWPDVEPEHSLYECRGKQQRQIGVLQFCPRCDEDQLHFQADMAGAVTCISCGRTTKEQRYE